jgi:hypothetical protein
MDLCGLYGFLLEGFTLFSLDGRLLTVMVTISSCIQCYGVVVYVSIHIFATIYLFSWSWSLFVVLASTHRPLCQEVCFRVVGSPWGLHFHRHCYVLVWFLRRA